MTNDKTMMGRKRMMVVMARAMAVVMAVVMVDALLLFRVFWGKLLGGGGLEFGGARLSNQKCKCKCECQCQCQCQCQCPCPDEPASANLSQV